MTGLDPYVEQTTEENADFQGQTERPLIYHATRVVCIQTRLE